MTTSAWNLFWVDRAARGHAQGRQRRATSSSQRLRNSLLQAVERCNTNNGLEKRLRLQHQWILSVLPF